MVPGTGVPVSHNKIMTLNLTTFLKQLQYTLPVPAVVPAAGRVIIHSYPPTWSRWPNEHFIPRSSKKTEHSTVANFQKETNFTSQILGEVQKFVQ